MNADWKPEGSSQIIGYLAALLGILGLTRPKVKLLAKAAFELAKGSYERNRDYKKTLAEFGDLAHSLDKLSTLVEGISYQVSPNGSGSMRDMCSRIESGLDELRVDVKQLTAEEGDRFKNEPYPSFKCDDAGCNVAISNAYLTLLGVQRTEDLLDRDWAQYIDGGQRDDYLKHVMAQLGTKSDFRYTLGFYNNIGAAMGRWQVKGTRITDKLWKGKLTPRCQISRRIAEQNGWSLE